MFEVGTILKLPLKEEGRLLKIKNLLWGFKYVVEITKGGLFNEVGDVCEYKESQLVKKFDLEIKSKQSGGVVTNPRPLNSIPSSRVHIKAPQTSEKPKTPPPPIPPSTKRIKEGFDLFTSETRKEYTKPSKYKHKDVEKLVNGILKNESHYECIKGFNDKLMCNFCGESKDVNDNSKIKHSDNCIYKLALEMDK